MREDWRSAVITGDYVNIASLLAEGTEINQRDRYGQTALMLAARHGRAEVVRLLLEYKAEMDVTAKYGLSALMLAVLYRHMEVAKQLVDAGATLDCAVAAHRDLRERQHVSLQSRVAWTNLLITWSGLRTRSSFSIHSVP